MDLGTTYLGMRLPHPLIVGAGPLGDELDTVRALEDAGASLIVMRSLFEEEITGEQIHHFTHTEGYAGATAEAYSFGPDPEAAFGPDEYLEHLRAVKQAVGIPVVASLNGCSRGGWIAYSRLLQDAGADAIELHVYHAASDPTMSASDVEQAAVDIVRELKRTLGIPVAVKLTPHYTAFAHFAHQLDGAGADGFVLFTRLHRVDIDVDALELVRSMPLTDSSELTMRLRGAAILSGRVKASLAITGGVHTAVDVIKATMAGAHATQLVSALLRQGPGHVRALLRDITDWMAEREWPSLDEMRGNMSLGRIPNPVEYERVNFRMALR